MDIRERFWTWWFDGVPQPVADRMFNRVVNDSAQEIAAKLADDNRALRAENADLRRQLEDARDMVVRSGYFIDCERGPGRDCVMWHRAGQHEGVAEVVE